MLMRRNVNDVEQSAKTTKILLMRRSSSGCFSPLPLSCHFLANQSFVSLIIKPEPTYNCTWLVNILSAIRHWKSLDDTCSADATINVLLTDYWVVRKSKLVTSNSCMKCSRKQTLTIINGTVLSCHWWVSKVTYSTLELGSLCLTVTLSNLNRFL